MPRLLRALTCLLLLTPGLTLAATVTPVEIDESLANPGRGWMTMFGPAIGGQPVPQGVTSTLYYHRINWAQVHTGPDQYDWTPIDDAIDRAQQGGQQIMLRLMPVWEESSGPDWMQQAGYAGFDCSGRWAPDLGDSRVQDHAGRFLAALGARYDGHVGVDAVEINLLGCWGEGNWACCSPAPPDPSPTMLHWLADAHYAAFQETPLIGPIGGWGITGYMYQQHAADRGTGIFFDCWGDYGVFGPDWNHMENGYPMWLSEIHGGSNWDSWQRGPWKLEPCATLNDWPDDIPRALQWAIDQHASYIGNKAAAIPTGFDDRIRVALNHIGYRLVLRQLVHADAAAAGSALDVVMQFDNVGNAPPYHDYQLAIQLRGSRTETLVSSRSIKGWLPGVRTETVTFALPSDLPAGDYTVAIGVVTPYDQTPAIRLAIAGRDSEGWYPLSTLTVLAPGSDAGNHDATLRDVALGDVQQFDTARPDTGARDRVATDAGLRDSAAAADRPASDSTSGSDASVSVDTATGVDHASSSTNVASGCSCRVNLGGKTNSPAVALLAGLALFWRWRSRTSRSR